MFVLNIVNSFIGKKGNIGLRTGYIIDELHKQNIANFSYSRGVVSKYKQKNKNMGIFGHIPRLLNAYRIYFQKSFNHRVLDIKLFELFFKLNFKDVNYKSKIAHVWETSPKIIKFLKDKGYKVILDVPIAPTKFAINIAKKYDEDFSIDYSFNIDYEQQCFELTDYIIAPSDFVKNEIIKLGINENKIFVVPFGVDLKQSYKREFNKDYQKKGIDFCFVGTINKRKGIEILLRAWDDKRFKNDRLHLCGRLYPEIEEVLNKYKFKNVILPGFIDPKDYLKNCDVYVFPSFLEGSSKSIYEAMSMSLPCIVTYNSGSIIRDSVDGFVIEAGNIEELKEKMLEFKKNTYLIKQMGENAYNNVQNYSWQNYAKNIISIYRQVLNK